MERQIRRRLAEVDRDGDGYRMHTVREVRDECSNTNRDQSTAPPSGDTHTRMDTLASVVEGPPQTLSLPPGPSSSSSPDL